MILAACVLVGIAMAGCVLSLYISLGPFWPLALVAGSALAVVATRRLWRNTSRSVLAAVGFGGAYSFIQVALLAVSDTRSRESFVMRPIDAGASSLPREMRLAFQEAPGSFIGLRSPELAAYLDTTAASEVPAEFTVSRALGCVRGFTTVRVGPVILRPATEAYFGSGNPARVPFRESWWCP